MLFIGVGNLYERTEEFNCWFDESVLEYSCNSSNTSFSLTTVYNWKWDQDLPLASYPDNKWVESNAILR